MANERRTASGTVTKGVTRDEAKRRLAALRDSLGQPQKPEERRGRA